LLGRARYEPSARLNHAPGISFSGGARVAAHGRRPPGAGDGFVLGFGFGFGDYSCPGKVRLRGEARSRGDPMSM
jgi:hypothetical protein